MNISPIVTLSRNENRIERYDPEPFRALQRRETQHYRFGPNPNFSEQDKAVYANDRKKIVQWYIDLSGTYGLLPDIVSIATSIFDQSTSMLTHYQRTPKEYSLNVSAPFFLATKLNNPKGINPTDLVRLSRNEYTEEELLSEEKKILKDLNWYVNPPTLHAFSHEFLNILQPSPTCRKEMEERIQYQIEKVMQSNDLMYESKAEMAYIMVMNTLQDVRLPPLELITYTEFNEFSDKLATDLNIRPTPELGALQARILQAVIPEH